MKTFIVWLLVSSKDPQKWSLTIKAVGTTLITALTVVLGLAHITVGDLTPLVDGFIAVVQNLLLLISSIVALIAFVRKCWRTYKGDHAGLNTYEIE